MSELQPIKGLLKNISTEVRIRLLNNEYVVECVCGSSLVVSRSHHILSIAMLAAFNTIIEMQGISQSEMDEYKQDLYEV